MKGNLDANSETQDRWKKMLEVFKICFILMLLCCSGRTFVFHRNLSSEEDNLKLNDQKSTGNFLSLCRIHSFFHDSAKYFAVQLERKALVNLARDALYVEI